MVSRGLGKDVRLGCATISGVALADAVGVADGPTVVDAGGTDPGEAVPTKVGGDWTGVLGGWLCISVAPASLVASAPLVRSVAAGVDFGPASVEGMGSGATAGVTGVAPATPPGAETVSCVVAAGNGAAVPVVRGTPTPTITSTRPTATAAPASG